MKRVNTYLKNKKKDSLLASVYSKYREFTMIQKQDFVDCLSLVSDFKSIEGSVVECGVWRGGMIAGIAELLGNKRAYYLFDSFEGLPPAKEIDGKAAIAWQKDTNSPGYYNNCSAEMEWAEKAMKKSGVSNYKLIQGWFDKTIPPYTIEKPIAILHLDGDWYDSTMTCLESLFPKVAKGGLIILDDYYVWEGCSKALHDYLAKNKRPEVIDRAYSSGCYLIKNKS